LSSYGDNIQFARSGHTYTLYNADGELIGSASVDGAELHFTMLDGSEHRVNAWGAVDDGTVSVPSDPEGGGNSAESSPITGDEPPPTTVFGAVQSVQSLLQAIEAGDTRAIVTASASLLANIDRLTGGVLPEGVAPGLNALAASLNLLTAIQDGNGLAIAASSLNLSSQAASLYAGMLRDQGIAAFQAGDASAKSMLEGAGTVGQVAGALALAASVVSLVMAIEGGNGYQIASASLGVVSGGLAMAGGAYTPWAFPVAAVAMAVTLVGSYISDKDIPTLEGEATAVWNPDGSIHVLSTLDLEQGGATPARLLQSLVDGLQQSLASQVDANGDPLYAIIPQRLPTIGYAYDPDSPHGNFAVFFGGAPGHLYLKWIDENGQEQTRYFDGSGSRNQEGQATLAQEFMSHALRAVVPAWEAESVLAHMRDAGALSAPMTGSIDENRARVAQQLHNQDWQQPDAHAGMPTEDADGITQRFTALTVELKPELPAGVSTGRVGRNVDLDVYIEQTDWVQANQGILAIDLNGDGVIGQNEILTTDTQAAADHARNSLQWLDINHDSKLDASDPAFKALGIWLDANRNGQTDDGEFASFLDRGVASLDFTGAPPVLRAADGSIFHVTEQHLSADVRGDHYLAGFADTDGDGQIDAFAGVLHAHEGGETVLNAVVTHDYTGEAGHTHGGGVAGEGEMRVDVSDDAIHTTSDRQHTQILAEDVIAAGDIRVTSGARILPVGETTNTQVAAGDARLTSNGSAASSRPARRTESLAANDRRVKSEPPANASDAFAAIRNAWIKSSDSLFGATGALMGVAVGTVAGAAAAAPFTQDPDAVQTLAGSDPTASNTVSAVPSDVNFEPTTSTAPSAPRFVASPVASLAPAQPSGTNSLADGLTVDVAPSQIVSVPGSGITVSDVPVSALTGATLAPAPSPDVRLAVPDVVDDQVAGFEDTRYGFDAALLLANDTTRNTSSQPLKLTQVFGAEHGTVSMTVQPDGSQRIVFVPDQDYWGPARFRYTVEDAYGLASQGRVALDIAPVNDAPVTAGEYVESDEDTGILLTPAQLLANDFDVDTATMGDVLSVVRVSDAQHGLAVMDAAGNVRFLPDHDYFGPAGFTYWVSDGNGALTPTAVRIEILPVNDAPVVAGETVSTDEDTVLLIQQAALLTNDSDVDNPHGDLTIFAVRPGQHGAVELLPDGQIRFVPEQDYFGKATFLYTVSDGSGGYTEAVATVDLAPVNDAPIVTGEQFAGAEDEAITFASKSLLANDQDVDDAQSSLTLVAVGNAAHGEVRLNADGSIQFIPDADYFGAASFEYTVSDPLGATTTGRVDIDLAPVNDAPRLQPDVLAGAEDTALTIESAALLANDVDVDNDHTALTVTRASSASHGAVSLNPDGSIRFVPDQDFYGDASFTYEVRDGAGGLSTATTTVHVAPVNDAPIANDNLVDSRKGVAVTITAAALLGDDYDIDNAHTDLRIVGVADAENGTVRLNADGSVTFLPDPGHGGYPGAHGQFTYTISDGAGGFATATTVVNLEKINTAPVVVDDGFSGYENTPFVINAAQFRLRSQRRDRPRAGR
jgi:hypothetical protein